MQVSLNVVHNTYKICVSLGRTGPPFSDSDYTLVSTIQLQVHRYQPPPPPSPPPPPRTPPLLPPHLPPNAPPPPPTIPPISPPPVFAANERGGLSVCAFHSPSGSALLPPLPPLGELLPPSPNAPVPPVGGGVPSPPASEDCLTLGSAILLSCLLLIGCGVFLVCYYCKRRLDGIHCGPNALFTSFKAVFLTVPENTTVAGDLKKVNLDFSIESLRSRTGVRICCTCCCLLFLAAAIAGIVVGTTS